MTTLGSFNRPVSAFVAGASGAIGGAIIDRLMEDSAVQSVLACSRMRSRHQGEKVTHRTIDILDEASIGAALDGVEHIDLAIVATGVLHHQPSGISPEKSWRVLERDSLLRTFAVNAVGPALVAKHVLPLLRRRGKAVFAALSARVGSISDNQLGGWYGYRASKAALNQIVRTLATELSRQRPDAICVGLHPGTVACELSRPFQSNVGKDKLFTPAFAANRLLSVIDDLDGTSTSQLLAWDRAVIAP